MNKTVKIIVLLACLGGIIFFSYNIVKYFIEENASQNLNDDLRNIAIITENNEKSNNIEEKNEQKEQTNGMPIKVNFEKIKQKNSDIIGWLYLENSLINYPVVQSNDNEYYLRRLIDGSYNRAGTIFVDYRCDKTFNDSNTIIYGHNMQNDSMFGSIIKYKEQEYYDSHREMFLFTPEQKYKIELFAGFETVSDSDIYNFPKSDKTNRQLIEIAKKQSTFKSEVEISENDKIITFSTCSYDFDDARYVLLGVLKGVEI